MNPKISIVSPVYRAEPIVDKLVERIATEVSKISTDFEIILVEDCGPDASWDKIQENCKKFPYVKGIKLSRNFGQQHAMQAGLDASTGDFIVTLDCDLQDKPEEIIKLYNKALEGFDIVIASRKNRQDDFLKKFFSVSFYKVLGYLTETEQDSSVANFVLFRRNALDAIKAIKDNKRYYPMLIQWVGFNTVKVEIEHAEREEGGSSYNFKKRINLALDTILTFSDKPLRLSVKMGVFISVLAIIGAVSLVFIYLLSDIQVEGWASLAVLITFFSGVIISVLGMVGLYVGRTFESVKQRPTYIIHKTENL